MAIQRNPIFAGFSGSVNRQLLLRQVNGQTIVSAFPDRSKVVYSPRQLHERVRFKDAVSFARVVIKNSLLRAEYELKAKEYNLRSAWNAAIAEYMCKTELKKKPKKVRFDKSIITNSLGFNCKVKLYKKMPLAGDFDGHKLERPACYIDPALKKECESYLLHSPEFKVGPQLQIAPLEGT